MRAYIENDPLLNMVRVWMFRDEPGGRVYMWPIGYPDDSKCMIYKQEIVPHEQAPPDTVRPFLEMSRSIWDAVVKALRATEFEKPAGKMLTQVLEREQNRVDALITALIKTNEPQWILQKPMEE